MSKGLRCADAAVANAENFGPLPRFPRSRLVSPPHPTRHCGPVPQSSPPRVRAVRDVRVLPYRPGSRGKPLPLPPGCPVSPSEGRRHLTHRICSAGDSAVLTDQPPTPAFFVYWRRTAGRAGGGPGGGGRGVLFRALGNGDRPPRRRAATAPTGRLSTSAARDAPCVRDGGRTAGNARYPRARLPSEAGYIFC